VSEKLVQCIYFLKNSALFGCELHRIESFLHPVVSDNGRLNPTATC
jgi:hypothetical protein